MTNETTLCRRTVDLDGWSRLEWRNGVQLDSLRRLDELRIRTCNTIYELTVLGPQTGEVLVRGGRFFPVCTPARLAGCSLGGAFLKVRGIYVGFSLELCHDDRNIVTTRVQSIVRSRATEVH
jgi:hypothetical protein